MSTQFDKSIFGERLKKTRLSRGYKTQTEFANAIGISGQAVSYYESGQRLPDAGTLYLLSSFFECSIDWLLGISDNFSPDSKYIEEVTGLNDAAIEHLGEWGHIEPSKKLILNMLLSDFYINNLVDNIQTAVEHVIKTSSTYQDIGQQHIDLLRKERDLHELAEDGNVFDGYIEWQRQSIEREKEIRKHLEEFEGEKFEYRRSENIEFCKFQFLRTLEEFLDSTAAALSDKYAEWLIGEKLEEIEDLRFISAGGGNGINKT